jgi:hypothetical protein
MYILCTIDRVVKLLNILTGLLEIFPGIHVSISDSLYLHSVKHPKDV